MSRHLFLPALALLAAGCGGPASDPGGNEAAPPTAQSVPPALEDVAAPNALAVPPPPSDTLPSEIVVSTNEPFWQARIGARTIKLSGAGQDERELDVVETASDEAGRHVLARDGAFTLEAVVKAAPCEDSMSGAHFPYSATLQIDGGPAVAGCARSTADPPPVPQ